MDVGSSTTGATGFQECVNNHDYGDRFLKNLYAAVEAQEPVDPGNTTRGYCIKKATSSALAGGKMWFPVLSLGVLGNNTFVLVNKDSTLLDKYKFETVDLPEKGEQKLNLYKWSGASGDQTTKPAWELKALMEQRGLETNYTDGKSLKLVDLKLVDLKDRLLTFELIQRGGDLEKAAAVRLDETKPARVKRMKEALKGARTQAEKTKDEGIGRLVDIRALVNEATGKSDYI